MKLKINKILMNICVFVIGLFFVGGLSYAENQDVKTIQSSDKGIARPTGIEQSDDLDDWEPLATNEMVEFPVDRNPSNRKYYMYFGAIDTTTNDGLGPASSFKRSIPPYNPTDLVNPSLGQFGVITEATQFNQTANAKRYMSYNYRHGRVNNLMYGLALYKSSADQTNHTSVANTYNTNFSISKLFSKKSSPGLRGYSQVTNKAQNVIGELRITLTPVGKTGRIKSEITFEPTVKDDSYWTFAYGIHSDLAGSHFITQTYSMGNLSGLFVQIDGVSSQQWTPDKGPYRLYFHRDGYPNQPEEFRPKDELISTSDNIISGYWGGKPFSKGITLADDPGRNKQYKADHPIYSFKWDPRQLDENGQLNLRLDQSVTEESAIGLPPVVKLDKTDDEIGETDYRLTGSWSDEDSDEVELFYQIDDGEAKSLGKQKKTEKDTPFTYDIPLSELPKQAHNVKVYAIDTDKLSSNVAELNLIKRIGYVTVEYYSVDEKKLLKTIELKGEINKPYTAPVEKFEGYKVVSETPPGYTGVFEQDRKVVRFDYRKKAETITVRYIDTYGDEVASQEIFEGYLGDSITTNFKNLESKGYFLDKGEPKTKTIDFKETAQVIDFLYTGTIGIVSATPEIEFETTQLITNNNQIKTVPTNSDLKLNMLDTKKEDWSLTLKVKENFKSLNTQQNLNGYFEFISKDNKKIKLNDNASKIFAREKTQGGQYWIEWLNSDKQGLFLTVEPGNVKETYEGTFEWNLVLGP